MLRKETVILLIATLSITIAFAFTICNFLLQNDYHILVIFNFLHLNESTFSLLFVTEDSFQIRSAVLKALSVKKVPFLKLFNENISNELRVLMESIFEAVYNETIRNCTFPSWCHSDEWMYNLTLPKSWNQSFILFNTLTFV